MDGCSTTTCVTDIGQTLNDTEPEYPKLSDLTRDTHRAIVMTN